jgi:hypothetical protein
MLTTQNSYSFSMSGIYIILPGARKNVGQNDIKLCIVYSEPFLAFKGGIRLKNRSNNPFGPILGTFEQLFALFAIFCLSRPFLVIFFT